MFKEGSATRASVRSTQLPLLLEKSDVSTVTTPLENMSVLKNPGSAASVVVVRSIILKTQAASLTASTVAVQLVTTIYKQA